MTEKIPCSKCGALILPVTAKHTGGFCMPCQKGIPSSVFPRLPREPASPIPKLYDIRTNAEWRALGLDDTSIEEAVISAELVPLEFRHLIPYAQKWGISCDVRRGCFFDKQSAADIENFYQAVKPHLEKLNDWIDEPPLEEPKLTFLIMLKAYSEAVPPPPTGFRGAIMRKKDNADPK